MYWQKPNAQVFLLRPKLVYGITLDAPEFEIYDEPVLWPAGVDAKNRCPVGSVQCIHDLRMSWPPQNLCSKPWWIAALISYGIALFEYLFASAPQSHRGGTALTCSTKSHAGGDHTRRLRAVRDDVHGSADEALRFVGRIVFARCGVLYFSDLVQTHFVRHRIPATLQRTPFDASAPKMCRALPWRRTH